jgi:hypothetical protein
MSIRRSQDLRNIFIVCSLFQRVIIGYIEGGKEWEIRPLIMKTLELLVYDFGYSIELAKISD